MSSEKLFRSYTRTASISKRDYGDFAGGLKDGHPVIPENRKMPPIILDDISYSIMVLNCEECKTGYSFIRE